MIIFFFTGSCASVKELTCLHLLYSFPCINDDDCFESGMTCCETKCEYGKKMCVPRGKTLQRDSMLHLFSSEGPWVRKIGNPSRRATHMQGLNQPVVLCAIVRMRMGMATRRD